MTHLKRDIDTTLACYHTCSETYIYCVAKGGQYASPEHLGNLLDCARMCELNVDFMLRESPNYDRTCQLCADICMECADSCLHVAPDDRQLQKCIDTCQKCSECCEEM